MNISCLQENLSKGLSIVGRSVATRTTLPITNNVLLATENSRLKLAATNLEIAISCWIGAKIEEEGAITVPARLLTEFVTSLPSDRIDLSFAPRTHTLQLRCARFEARISGMDAQDFPPIPQVGDGVTVEIDPQLLHTAITQVIFAAATDDARPVLTGVHTRLEGKELTLAAADGFRLAVHKSSLISPVAEKTEFITPARSLAELNRLLPDQEEPVKMTVGANRNQAVFHLDNVEIVSQLIQGAYPNYNQLIPQECKSRAVVDALSFQRATRSAAIFARDGSGIIRLQVTPGKMTISARAEEVGDNLGELDANVEGEEAKIAFNSKYLADVLGIIDTAKVALETTSASSPGIIRPLDSDNYIHVIMPMFVQW
ncbi:MAG: DNA polymerase III subunit beta [Chloroflexi bacterium]|nr:DNA polymerase III subunit beta [Chloroflexota bacterium]